MDAKYQAPTMSAEAVLRNSDATKTAITPREGSQRTKITDSNKDSLKLTEMLVKSNT